MELTGLFKKKLCKNIYYYESFGNLRSPPELLRYFEGCQVSYSYNRQQQSSDLVNCGNLCLKFLTDNV